MYNYDCPELKWLFSFHNPIISSGNSYFPCTACFSPAESLGGGDNASCWSAKLLFFPSSEGFCCSYSKIKPRWTLQVAKINIEKNIDVLKRQFRERLNMIEMFNDLYILKTRIRTVVKPGLL